VAIAFTADPSVLMKFAAIPGGAALPKPLAPPLPPAGAMVGSAPVDAFQKLDGPPALVRGQSPFDRLRPHRLEFC
jgi:hypothetical protein